VGEIMAYRWINNTTQEGAEVLVHRLQDSEIQEHMLVNDYETALFYKNGVLVGQLPPGNHELRPILRKIPGIKQITNRLKDLGLEIVYLHTGIVTLKWGGSWMTSDNVKIGGRGEILLKISEPDTLMRQIVGSSDVDYRTEHFREKVLRTIQDVIRPSLSGISVAQVHSTGHEFTNSILQQLRLKIIGSLGVELLDFNAQWNLPDEILIELQERGFGEASHQRMRKRTIDSSIDDIDLEDLRERKKLEREAFRLQNFQQTGVNTSEYHSIGQLDSSGTRDVLKERARKPFSDVNNLSINETRFGNDTSVYSASVKDSILQSKNSSPQSLQCPQCGNHIEQSWKHCPNCGKAF